MIDHKETFWESANSDCISLQCLWLVGIMLWGVLNTAENCEIMDSMLTQVSISPVSWPDLYACASRRVRRVTSRGGFPTESQTTSFNPLKRALGNFQNYAFFRVPCIITSVLLTQSS